MWPKTTGAIADLVGGDLEGNPDVEINGIAPLENAQSGDIGYVSDEKYREPAAQSNASALIVADPIPGFSGIQIVCPDPELAFLHILESIREDTTQKPEGIHDTAVISPEVHTGTNVSVGACATVESGAKLGDNVTVYPHAYIGHDVEIGAETVIYPHVTIRHSVRIGERCIIRPNTVIGDVGFGFIQREGKSYRMQHVASVQIGDDVEIGGLSSIDRGMIEDTCIGDGVKMDKHCHVAHNCVIENHCILAGYTRMGGSCTVRQEAVLAADVRLSDHIEVGEKAILAAGTGAIQDVEPGARMWGTPARPLREKMRLNALVGRLPDMRRTIRDLESKVEDLEQKLDG